MKWKPSLTTEILAGKGPEIMDSFLKEAIPPFQAPIDAAAWLRKAQELRKTALKKIYLKGISPRFVQSHPRIVWGEVLKPCSEYVIRKLRYECYPSYWIPALLYEPTNLKGQRPVVLNPNGHHSGGKAVTYKQIRCANLARRGVLALNIEFIGMGELAGDGYHNSIGMLNLTSMAGVGLFYLVLKGLDLLLEHPHADPSKVGVTGLSGGGWQTIVISALDERVTLSVPVAGFTSARARVGVQPDIGDLEQVPVDLTTVLDYQDMTAMLAPRPSLLILNERDDCCFATPRTRPVIYDAVKPVFASFGAESRFQFYSNTKPGTHNYEADNRSRFYRFLMEQWGLSGPDRDLHQASDILSENLLKVGLPVNQETMQSLAVRRARKLALKRKAPKTASERQELRQRIRDIIHLPDFESKTVKAPKNFGARGGLVEIGPWKIPVSLSKQTQGAGSSLLLYEDGRKNFPGIPKTLVPASHLFLADILGTGENDSGWQAEMLLETSGHRLLGHQVAQVLELAQVVKRATGVRKVGLMGYGRFTSFVALMAAALEPLLFDSLTCYANVSSLVTLLEMNERYDALPGLFCFGLLEVADVSELITLLEDIPYSQPMRAVPVLKPSRE